MLRRPSAPVLALLTLALAAGCSQAPTAPQIPTLSGAWFGMESLPHPDGSVDVVHIELGMTQRDGGAVRGSGRMFVDGRPQIPVVVRLGMNTYPSFDLVLGLDGPEDIHVKGTFNSPQQLLVTLTGAGWTGQTVILNRDLRGGL